MLQILSLGNGEAVVSTENLFRLVIQPGNCVVDELVSAAEADAFIESFDAMNAGHWAERISYSQITQPIAGLIGSLLLLVL
jgi:hypothetical protein